MEAPHNSGRCCYIPMFKSLELLLATIKPYRLNSIWTCTQYWPGSNTGLADKLLCFEHPQVCWELLLLPIGVWPCHPTPAMKQGSSEDGEKKKKANMIPNSSGAGKFCLAHGRNESQPVKRALHQHKVVAGSHCLSGNIKPTAACW